jgi:hypothetical protein
MTNVDTVSDILKAAQEPIDNVIDTVSKLSQAASKMPYYKFNTMWSRQMQGAVGSPGTANRHHKANEIIVRERFVLGLVGRLQVRWR